MSKNNHVVVSDETIELIERCKDEFLKHHPEFLQMPISYNFIIDKITKFYLKHD